MVGHAAPIARATGDVRQGVGSRLPARALRGRDGGDDYDAVAQLRDPSGGWVDVATGSVAFDPLLDGSGRYLAFTAEKANSSKRRLETWVYVASLSEARVLMRKRLQPGRYVAGWLGDRVIVTSALGVANVWLLPWHRATPSLDDLGSAVVYHSSAGDINVIAVRGDQGCVGVGRFLHPVREIDGCVDDQILAMSPEGRTAITYDLRWVQLRSGAVSLIGERPDGIVARSASFLPDGSALVNVTLDGVNTAATLHCTRDACTRVLTRSHALRLW